MISDPPCAVGGRPLASATHGRRRPRPGAACAAFAPRRVPRGARGVLRPRRAAHSPPGGSPGALEAFFARVGELKIVLGPGAAAGVDGLEALIQEGLAARDLGDAATAVRRIVQAMERLCGR